MELFLEEAQLVGPPDERRLEGVGPPRTAALADDPDRPPGRDGRGLALELLLARRRELDGGLGRDPGGLADQDACQVPPPTGAGPPC